MATVGENNYMDKATDHMENENESCPDGYVCLYK